MEKVTVKIYYISNQGYMLANGMGLSVHCTNRGTSEQKFNFKLSGKIYNTPSNIEGVTFFTKNNYEVLMAGGTVTI